MVGHHQWTAKPSSGAWRTFVVKVIILSPALPLPFSAPPLRSLVVSLERRLTSTYAKDPESTTLPLSPYEVQLDISTCSIYPGSLLCPQRQTGASLGWFLVTKPQKTGTQAYDGPVPTAHFFLTFCFPKAVCYIIHNIVQLNFISFWIIYECESLDV